MVEFLLSYDRDDGDGGFVDEFFSKLSDELARRSPRWSKDSVGYLDVRISTGSRWPEKLGEALQTCHVFVPLYSPRYFSSEYCGKEWWLFAERVRDFEIQKGRSTNLIIPVLWEPITKASLPAVALPIQWEHNEFPEIYPQRGLRRIVQVRNRYEEEYDVIANVLADLIVNARDADEMPSAVKPFDIEVAPNAFTPPVARGESGRMSVNARTNGTQAVDGPRRVYFVMAAATAEEALAIRTDLGGRYGAEPDEWMPYRPDVADPLILSAIDVARQQSPPLIPQPERIDGGDLVELIKMAEGKNAIVIVIVDAWTARLPKYQNSLRPYDDYFSLHTAVIVATNGLDPETARNLPALQAEVRGIFFKNFRGRRRFYHDAVTSLEEFRRILGEVLINTQGQVFENAQVHQVISPGESIPQPALTGPGGSS